jgi:general L-amino acid transport system permease protein
MAKDNNNLSPSNPPIWRNTKYRALFFQVVIVCIVAYLLITIVNNTLINLEARGISTGFDFLNEPSGFAILQSLIDYDESHTYASTFVVGLLNTFLVSSLGILFATILGFLMGIARLSSNWLIAKIAMVYIEVFRNIPLLLQILFWYFAVLSPLPSPRQSLSLFAGIELNVRGLYLPAPVPETGFSFTIWALFCAIMGSYLLYRWARKRREKTGKSFPLLLVVLTLIVAIPGFVFWISGSPLSWDYPTLSGFNFGGGITIIPELLALLLALSIYTGTFIAEIVRAGILSVSRGQTEAALSLGLSSTQTTRLIIIPQAMRVIIPPLTSQYLNLTKNSSLATAIGYPDLVSVFMGTSLNQTGQAVEIIAITMAVYLIISLLISLLMNWFNKKMALVER